MPTVVTDNQAQFGLFGIALALTTWLSGAAICILVGACAGPVLAENTGRLGALIRGRDPSSWSPTPRNHFPHPPARSAFETPSDKPRKPPVLCRRIPPNTVAHAIPTGEDDLDVARQPGRIRRLGLEGVTRRVDR